jgi:hypothetical protein
VVGNVPGVLLDCCLSYVVKYVSREEAGSIGEYEDRGPSVVLLRCVVRCMSTIGYKKKKKSGCLLP